MARSQELIESVLTACPAGPPRASLLLRLATIHYHQSGWPLAEQTFRQAAREARDDPALCAHAEQELAFARWWPATSPPPPAGRRPRSGRPSEQPTRAWSRTRSPGSPSSSSSRATAHGWTCWTGPRHSTRLRAREPLARLPRFDPSLTRGLVLKWSDRLDEARSRLADRYRHRIDRGDEASLPFLLYHFSELECWAGNWDAAEEYALEACQVADESRQRTMRPATLYSLALVRAHRGQVEQARELATEALALCDSTGNVPVRSMVLSVLGFIALSLDDYQAAHSHLGRLAEAAAVAGSGNLAW